MTLSFLLYFWRLDNCKSPLVGVYTHQTNIHHRVLIHSVNYGVFILTNLYTTPIQYRLFSYDWKCNLKWIPAYICLAEHTAINQWRKYLLAKTSNKSIYTGLIPGHTAAVVVKDIVDTIPLTQAQNTKLMETKLGPDLTYKRAHI